MKVLYVTHYSGFYGANKSLLQLILELKDAHAIRPLVVVPEKGLFTDELDQHTIPYRIFKFYNWQAIQNNRIKKIIKQGLNLFLFRLVLKQLKGNKHGLNLVHTNSSMTHLGAHIAKKLQLPHVWHIREFGKADYNTDYLRGIERAGKYMEKNSSTVVAISKAIKKYYAAYISEERISVIYNGVQVDKNYERRFNKKEALQLCFVGTLTTYKNQMEALRACERIVCERGENEVVLNIVGNGKEEYTKALTDFVQEKGLEKNVKFLGYVDDVNTMLDRFDVGIICSKKEAFGRVTVEYMGKKMPVIASNTGANAELVEHGKTGYIYDLGDDNMLADYIVKLMHDRDELENMGTQGHLFASENLTSRINTKYIYETYEKHARPTEMDKK